MPAKHALLGLLLDGPAYPYQLADRLQQRLGPTWEVNSGKLYQTVKGLERDGLIRRTHGADAARRNRHVYAITDEGVAEFERWFDRSVDAVRLPRRPLLVKIAFAGPERLREAMAEVDAYELDCARRLEEIAGLREALRTDGALIRADQLLLRLSLSADFFQLEGELQWARQAREVVSWLGGEDVLWPSRRRGSRAAHRQHEREGARGELFRRMAGSDDAGSAPAEGPAGE